MNAALAAAIAESRHRNIIVEVEVDDIEAALFDLGNTDDETDSVEVHEDGLSYVDAWGYTAATPEGKQDWRLRLVRSPRVTVPESRKA